MFLAFSEILASGVVFLLLGAFQRHLKWMTRVEYQKWLDAGKQESQLTVHEQYRLGYGRSARKLAPVCIGAGIAGTSVGAVGLCVAYLIR